MSDAGNGGQIQPSSGAGPGPAAGWYPDPDGGNTQRYWDGNSWTDNRAPLVPGQQGPIPQKNNGFAIASMVLGIVWVYWIGSILALVFGYVALSQIEKSGGTQSGRGMAIAGVVLGWIGVGFLILLIILAAAGSATFP